MVLKLTSIRFMALFVLATALLSCSSLLYYPDHYMYVDEELMEHKPEDHILDLQTGEKIHIWYFSAKQKPKGVFVFFHGNGQNRSSHFIGLYWLIKEGYDLLALEYPGYGETDGEPTPENTVESGKAAMRYAYKRNPSLPIIVYGQSLGGAVALKTALDLKNEIPISLIIADSTFLSYKKVAQVVLARSWLTWLFQLAPRVVLSDKYAPGDEVAQLSPIPLLVIHDEKDPVVPFELGKEVYEKAKEPKEFWPLSGGGHAQPYTGIPGLTQRKRLLEKLKTLFAETRASRNGK